MLRIRNIKVNVKENCDLKTKAADILRCRQEDIRTFRIVRRSVDARKKDNVAYVYTCDVVLDRKKEEQILKRKRPNIEKTENRVYRQPRLAEIPEKRPVIAGFGPAGIFCSLLLARAGARPIVLERGSDAETRKKKVEEFRTAGKLDTECNVQFGEGGAGTFSDGKLTTGVNDTRIPFVLRTFADHGAPDEITYDAKPHIGTDILTDVIVSIRKEIERLGGEVLFDTRLVDVDICSGAVSGVSAVDNRTGEKLYIETDSLVMAVGHSARDTFEMLDGRKISMEPKPFAMGVRIEHKQSWLNGLQYGDFSPYLPAADYKVNCKTNDGTGVYTFCMCPGGYVIAAASEDEGVVTNGMSNNARDGENCNAALLVTLHPEDFPYDGPLGGAVWQREIEHSCYVAGGSNYNAPAQTVGDFLSGKKTESFADVTPTYIPGVTGCDLSDVLPCILTERLKEAIIELDRKLPGFAYDGAVLTAPESRSSSPVRIIRDSGSLESVSVSGLYPCGEGAGYAGGIMSAALDGIKVAETYILKKLGDLG